MADTPTRRRTILKRSGIGAGVFVLLIVLLILFWSWDWFIPLVESRASAAIGRNVTIAHLHVRLGRVTRIVADDVEVDGTQQFPDKLAKVKALEIAIEVLPLIRHRDIVIPLIDVRQPAVRILGDSKGNNNFTFETGSGGKSKENQSSSGPQLGVLKIEDGHIHVDDPKFKALADIDVETRGAPDPFVTPLPKNQGEIVADGKGRYAGQPVTLRFVGGAILSLRDKTRPYPIDLQLANGPTHVRLKGTIEQPLTFGGARLSLNFAGPDMSLLYPLTGVPIPQTPPYKVTGQFDYSKSLIAFRDFEGKVGNSDLGGTISAVPARIPTINADLHSRNVDLADLGGFVGSKVPGKADTKTEAQKKAAGAAKSGSVLPDTPINVPKVKAANIHLTYRGSHIENPDVPLDDITARLDIDNGVIDLKQLDFKVGTGRIASSVFIDPDNGMRTKAHADFDHLDLSRIMQATHAFHGQGVLGGKADLVSNGNSVAKIMANGSGGLTLVMSGGGDISALLPDLAGLEIGKAILSAIGMPSRTPVQCFVADLPLKNGIMSTDAFLLQTGEARTVGQGTVNFRDQTIDYSLTTRSTHFSVGSLPGPINITGKLSSPSITPGAEVAARTGAATALGVVLPPLALLPTVQFGVGEAGACRAALSDVQEHPAAHGQAGTRSRAAHHPRHTHH
ncbi:AsmA family protein [Acetobacteraceae bacterium KSS8]|uniref:AsmA family protein n=1 Tax=Endosaccharibacter trunci TaxID=2812733 RepID=A0ABT1W739_9PROT|nr:AsmA family protein [Acetobacteraceae bacterium KSS8]